MNVNMQKCNVCEALNEKQAKDWVRVIGATNDPARPVNSVVDLCPACADKTNVSALPALAKPAPKPIAIAQPPAAAPAQ